MRKISVYILYFIIFLTVIGTSCTGTENSIENTYEQSLMPANSLSDIPVFSAEAGFYYNEFYLTITGNGTIHFTLDGSVPTSLSAVYTNPILIHSPDPIPENSPMSSGVRLRSINNYYNAMVVRAVLVAPDGSYSDIVTRTFFVDKNGRSKFSTPVISVSINSEYFTGDELGMYRNWSVDFRHPAYIEVFYPNGDFMLSQSAQMRVSGNSSRAKAKKQLRFNFNRGCGVIDNPDFISGTKKGFHAPDEPVTLFKHATARVSDWSDVYFYPATTFREIFTAYLGESLRPDVMNSVFAAVFVNGEFWGMYDWREHRSDVFIAAR